MEAIVITTATIIVKLIGAPVAEILEILAETEKAINVKNTETGDVAWLPKSGLAPYKPNLVGVKPASDGYEGEFVVRPWFRNKLSRKQEKVLGILE